MLTKRSAFSESVDQDVDQILEEIKSRGDKAIQQYAKKFDHVDLDATDFLVNASEIEAAANGLHKETKEAIISAHQNIQDFANQRKPIPWRHSPRTGVQIGEEYRPFERIAAYIPGGSAPLVSTVLHTATFAQSAGVPEVVISTPPNKDKSVHPAILYAASIAGVSEIYKLGGVYAIGALAYGTETINKVDKIVGPGNAYVTAAKRKVYGTVSLDSVAGPSEVVVVADEGANPAFIAADLLAQAEHGSGNEIAILLSTSDSIIKAVQEEVNDQIGKRSRRDIMQRVVDNRTYLIQVTDIHQAITIANLLAPEHLELLFSGADELIGEIKNAGAVFVGPWSPEAVGDYIAGPSHVLPTGGAAKRFSGLAVSDFYKKISVIKYNQPALKREFNMLKALTDLEELEGHKHSVAVRLTTPNDSGE